VVISEMTCWYTSACTGKEG